MSQVDQKKRLKVALVGTSGYTGQELLRLLQSHRAVEVICLVSERYQGQRVSQVLRSSQGLPERFSALDLDQLAQCDVVFTATPNGFAMKHAAAILKHGAKLIDLSADFRLQDAQEWENWYGMRHESQEWLSQAVYGLCEWNQKAIAQARLVANPGCMATAILLALLPLQREFQPKHLALDVKSGISGAGRAPSARNLFCDVNENLVPYSVLGHRHIPEVRQFLNRVCNHTPGLTMLPMIVPMNRGIHVSAFAYGIEGSKPDTQDVFACYQQYYRDEPFIWVSDQSDLLGTAMVCYTNSCVIQCTQQPDADGVLVQSMIDNLGKGAAGQAVQNMNMMFGLDQSCFLKKITD